MKSNTKNAYRIATIAAVLVVLAGIAWYFSPAQRDARNDQAARQLMLSFGEKLKNVPLLGEDAAVTKAIEDNYAPYVTPELLKDWKANHAHAPGRLTSSPYPDRVGVATVVKQGSGRIINGEVIMVTSGESEGESADTVPYVAQLVPTENGWKIAAYQEQPVQTLKNLPTTDEDIPGAR